MPTGCFCVTALWQSRSARLSAHNIELEELRDPVADKGDHSREPLKDFDGR
jgi:hypothetical protein